MKIKIPYILTVCISIALIFIGHKIAMNGFDINQRDPQEIVKASVHKIIERIKPDGTGDFISLQEDKIIFEARIREGNQKGEIVTASQNLVSFTTAEVKQREVREGDHILLINSGSLGWYFNGYVRTNKLLVLGILFAVCVLVFGRKKGFNTILSLGLTCAAVFAVFIPSILSGKNIYLMAALVCTYTTMMTLLIVSGFNKKSFAAAAGAMSGIVVTGLITVIMDRVLFLSGIIDEHSRYLANLPLAVPINLRAIIFAGIIIGAMGAIMDVAMSISSSLWEIKEKAKLVNFKMLFRSGLNIGRDILGSMANTLILAYIGTSLSLVLLLGVYSDSLTSLFNMEMIVVEILQALAGSFGILFAIPLSSFFSATFYLKDKE